MVCGAGLCNGRKSVRLSVCPIIRPPHAAAEGLLLSARQAGDIDRLLLGAQQLQRRRSRTARSSKCGQCRADSRRRKLNADLSRIESVALHPLRSLVTSVLGHFGPFLRTELTEDRSD